MKVEKWNVIGLMSGTSLDGLDIIAVEFIKKNEVYSFKILATDTVPYSKDWENKLRNAFNASPNEIQELNILFGKYLGEAVNRFVLKNNLKGIDFIASHGQTIFHTPNEGYTLQIGDGKTLKETTGIKVICDFRTQDVLLGGQGAPLVPIGDKLLFSAFDYCINLGGFANISFEKNKERLAFDICPVNIVLNHYTRKLGFSYDNEGEISKNGMVNSALLNELNALEYYKLPIPKSLGFEYVDEVIFPLIDKYKLTEKDILRTFTEHVVIQISKCLCNSVKSKVLITGGGAFNSFLMSELKKQTAHEILIPSNDIVDYKEALIFGLLGVLKIQNEVNCLQSVTGATKDHSSGEIF